MQGPGAGTEDLIASPIAACATTIDVVIVGAGPAGLFAAFQAGVLGLDCVVIEATERPGGQCSELYPSKPIYDIPAIAHCTGQELVDRLSEQAGSFGAPIQYGDGASTLNPLDSGRWLVKTRTGRQYDTAAVLVAAGNGAFAPQRLSVDVPPGLEGQQVHYAVRNPALFAGQRVIVAGGGDSALDWALALRSQAQVTLVHRRPAYSGAPASAAALGAAAERGELQRVTATLRALQTTADGRLCGVEVLQADGSQVLPCDHLIVLYGLVAELGDLNQWGLANRAGRIPVDTATYETARPGVFAVGDIAAYQNKHKLILSAFHEAALALRHAYRYARPSTPLVHVHSSYDSRFKDLAAQPASD